MTRYTRYSIELLGLLGFWSFVPCNGYELLFPFNFNAVTGVAG